MAALSGFQCVGIGLRWRCIFAHRARQHVNLDMKIWWVKVAPSTPSLFLMKRNLHQLVSFYLNLREYVKVQREHQPVLSTFKQRQVSNGSHKGLIRGKHLFFVMVFVLASNKASLQKHQLGCCYLDSAAKVKETMTDVFNLKKRDDTGTMGC